MPAYHQEYQKVNVLFYSTFTLKPKRYPPDFQVFIQHAGDIVLTYGALHQGFGEVHFFSVPFLLFSTLPFFFFYSSFSSLLVTYSLTHTRSYSHTYSYSLILTHTHSYSLVLTHNHLHSLLLTHAHSHPPSPPLSSYSFTHSLTYSFYFLSSHLL
jgi:hypothetical protein